MEISVWAPDAGTVSIELQGRRLPMKRGADGWWSVAGLPEGPLDYAFVLDDGPPLPDPRSPWQPSGVHGPSRTVDHSRFSWTDHGWQTPPLASAIFYELHIGTFTPEGTFDAAIARIPHLLDLGITHIELMPVAEFPGDWGWGYDSVDLYAPHHSYGGPDGLKRLVNALHASGLAVVLDVVYNHFGPTGTYWRRFGPYFNDEYHTPWGAAVNLCGPDSDPVRAFLIDNALMWLRDYHFDGLRIDAVHALVDTSATHFLEELMARVTSLEAEQGRHLAVIAESDLNDPRLVRSRDLGGFGLSAQWSDDFHHALHTVLTGERRGYYQDFGSLKQLAKAIELGFVYDGCYSAFRRRRHGRALEAVPLTRLLGYLQNHDQVGNRAAGDRIGALASTGLLKIGAALVLLGPFVPMIFQGEEWAAGTPFAYFTNHQDPEVAKAVTEGRRREFAAFGWPTDQIPDPQARETFRRSKLNWAEIRRAGHRDMLAWYRDLIRLRKDTPELRSAPAKIRWIDEAKKLLVMDRGGIQMACNFGAAEVTVPFAACPVLLGSASELERRREIVVLPPESVAIFGKSGARSGALAVSSDAR